MNTIDITLASTLGYPNIREATTLPQLVKMIEDIEAIEKKTITIEALENVHRSIMEAIDARAKAIKEEMDGKAKLIPMSKRLS